MDNGVRVGTWAQLVTDGRLTGKVGSMPVLVVRDGPSVFALEDRCPHLGFPLHDGTVEAGLITCHWHHARFDLSSGCTLDPWADDAESFTVEVEADEVWVAPRPGRGALARHQQRLREGLEQAITLVIAKSTLALLDVEGGVDEMVRTGLTFGLAHRGDGWGAGLTQLVAIANVLDDLAPADRGPALIHALVEVARDTSGQATRFPLGAMVGADVDADRLAQWYRRFVDTRSSDAAERTLATAVAAAAASQVEAMVAAAVTDHIVLDGGHTIDFTNKVFESLGLGPPEVASMAITALVGQTCSADRAEESSEWQHPVDLVTLVRRAEAELADALRSGRAVPEPAVDSAALAWALLADDPEQSMAALLGALRSGATLDEVGRAVAYAAALRVVRFHVQNEFGDWDTVHHTFTMANAAHQIVRRTPTGDAARALVHTVARIHLDRFLNVPAARLPHDLAGSLAGLADCWEVQGDVDRAGREAYGYLRGGGSSAALVAALGHAVFREDAGFHTVQCFEAAVQQARGWPEGSEEQALILAAAARWIAAHAPTRREQSSTVRIAARLRRGEAVYEEAS